VRDPMMFVKPIDTISLFPSSWYPFMDAKDRPTATDSYDNIKEISDQNDPYFSRKKYNKKIVYFCLFFIYILLQRK
jgi:hypothetical protein